MFDAVKSNGFQTLAGSVKVYTKYISRSYPGNVSDSLEIRVRLLPLNRAFLNNAW